MGGGAFGYEAHAQSIVYSYDGGSPVTITSGQDFTVNVGTVTGAKVLRIYDPSFATLPDDDAGKITISGTLATGGQLRVLVAGASQGWLSSNTDPILQVGLRHLGVDAADGIVVTDADLRANTRLMAYVSGDVRGDITLGQVRRIQCGVPGSTPTGVIAANLTSTGANVPAGDGPLEGAVGYIIAGDAISGTIIATTPAAGAADIERVQVGPNEAAAGISGDIVSESGAIRAVYTTGPIDSGTSTLLRVHAANGIGQLRAVAGDTGPVLARTFKADVLANSVMASNPNTFAYVSPASDGPLGALETGGDLLGVVHAGNLTATNLGGGGARDGIYVGGICHAPITIDLVVDKAHIVARTFLAPVTIGYSQIGIVAATGGATPPEDPPAGYADGRIPEITVGYAELPAGAAGVYAGFARGLRGPGTYSRDIPTLVAEWFRVGGTVPSESCIHAESSIGTVTLRAMQSDPFVSGCSKYPPALEAPLIEELTIGAFAHGVVWSGQVGGSDPNVHYATIGVTSIGCMRQMSTLWMQSWQTADILTDMYGDIRVPSTPAGSAVRIGRVLGDEAAAAFPDEPPVYACECTTQPSEVACQQCDWQWNNFDGVLGLASPRNPWWPECNGVEDRAGQIIVHNDNGLSGQIIINAGVAGLAPAVLWSGKAQVGDAANNCSDVVISPAQSQPDLAPHYARLSADLGGGAVGLVPFALHDEDCDPPADAAQTARTFLNSEFC
ncbi:MAG: hypothetical protein WAZ94_00130, partial [Phycisphaerales bacterium]